MLTPAAHQRPHQPVGIAPLRLALDDESLAVHGKLIAGARARGLARPQLERRCLGVDAKADDRVGRLAITRTITGSLIFRRFLDLGSALLLIRELNAQGHRTKSWMTQSGTFREGRPFDKGTLYKILRNRTYLGEAVHKGKSYPGEHEPIVDRAIWDRVHEVLASNAKRRGNEARARTLAPLRVLIGVE